MKEKNKNGSRQKKSFVSRRESWYHKGYIKFIKSKT